MRCCIKIPAPSHASPPSLALKYYGGSNKHLKTLRNMVRAPKTHDWWQCAHLVPLHGIHDLWKPRNSAMVSQAGASHVADQTQPRTAAFDLHYPCWCEWPIAMIWKMWDKWHLLLNMDGRLICAELPTTLPIDEHESITTGAPTARGTGNVVSVHNSCVCPYCIPNQETAPPLFLFPLLLEPSLWFCYIVRPACFG